MPNVPKLRSRSRRLRDRHQRADRHAVRAALSVIARLLRLPQPEPLPCAGRLAAGRWL